MIFTFYNTLVIGQTASGKIEGAVVDEKLAALPFASIVLTNINDTTSAIGVTADENGSFSFDKVTNGSYIVAVSMVGYQKAVSEVFTITNNFIRIPTLQLASTPQNLSEVTISAKKPFIEQQIDKTVINVASSITSTGSSVLQVLEKSPGITVNAHQEEIELAGKSTPLILIDGRPTYLSQADLFMLLKNTPSENIEKIELITNPSSKYDASGNSGIINIIFKKGSRPGTNGSVTMSGSVITHGYGRGDIIGNVNHGVGKINLFASLNGMEGKGFSKTIYDRIITNGSDQTRFDQVYGNIHWVKNYGYRVGIDYNISKSTSVGAKVNGAFNEVHTLSRYSDTKLYDAQLTLKQSYYTTAATRNAQNNFNANFNLRHSTKKGMEITFDTDYLSYIGKRINSLTTSFFKPDGSQDGPPEAVRNTMPLLIRIGVTKLDFVKKFEKFSFEGGLKSSLVKADNEMLYESLENQWFVDSLRSDRFIYKENINAAYLSFQGPLTSRTTLQLGLRLEHTRLSGYSVTLKKRNDQNYVRPFPTLFLSHELNATNLLTCSYGYRIDRPNYQLLNPFESYLDPYTTLRGNPVLKPQFTHNIQLTHLLRGYITTTLAYSVVRDLIVKEYPYIVTEEQKMYLTPENMRFQRNLNVTISAPISILPWWIMQVNLSGQMNRYRAYYKYEVFNVRQSNFTFALTNALNLGKDWTAEVSGSYFSRRIYGLIQSRPSGFINFGVQKSFLHNRMFLKFAGQDIFWTNKFVGSTKFADMNFTVTSLGVSQVFTISFSYKFGNSNISKEKPSNNHVEELQKRASGGI